MKIIGQLCIWIIAIQIICTIIVLIVVNPTINEKYISLQTVELRGEKYVCGTAHENRDKDSLYCTGFTDGYSWAGQQYRETQDFIRAQYRAENK